MATLNVTFVEPNPAPASGYQVKYRKVGTTDWSYVTGLISPITIPNVDGNADYEGTIKGICSDDASFGSTELSWTVTAIGEGTCYHFVADTNQASTIWVEYNRPVEGATSGYVSSLLLSNNGDGTNTYYLCSTTAPQFRDGGPTGVVLTHPFDLITGGACTSDNACVI